MKKLYSVFYKKMPVAIAELCKNDKNIVLSKNGLHTFGNLNCPRLTMSIELIGSHDEADKLNKINKLLDELEQNNQILGFSERYGS